MADRQLVSRDQAPETRGAAVRDARARLTAKAAMRQRTARRVKAIAAEGPFIR